MNNVNHLMKIAKCCEDVQNDKTELQMNEGLPSYSHTQKAHPFVARGVRGL